MGDFAARIDELKELVGHGSLVGNVKVDQVYAHYQHEGLDFAHPRGGQAKYLEEPLHAGSSGFWEQIAATALVEGEGPEKGMEEAVKHLGDEVKDKAPREFDNLRRSAALTVTSDGAEVYHKPAEVPRLSEEELKALNRTRPRRSSWRGWKP